MKLTTQQIDAIYKLYPQVVRTLGNIAYDAEGNQITYDLSAVTTQAQKDICKEKAKTLLAATDWAVLPDVGLSNQDAFVFYRLNLRNLVKDPVVEPVWESEPTPVWK
jgi:hypothetical protein